MLWFQNVKESNKKQQLLKKKENVLKYNHFHSFVCHLPLANLISVLLLSKTFLCPLARTGLGDGLGGLTVDAVCRWALHECQCLCLDASLADAPVRLFVSAFWYLLIQRFWLETSFIDKSMCFPYVSCTAYWWPSLLCSPRWTLPSSTCLGVPWHRSCTRSRRPLSICILGGQCKFGISYYKFKRKGFSLCTFLARPFDKLLWWTVAVCHSSTAHRQRSLLFSWEDS